MHSCNKLSIISYQSCDFIQFELQVSEIKFSASENSGMRSIAPAPNKIKF